MKNKEQKGFTLEEYNELFNYIKECHGKELFEGLNIIDDELFCYTPEDKTISVLTYFEKDECEIDIPEKFLVKYANETFNLNIPNTPKYWSIFSFLHELGHYMDLNFRTEKDFNIYHQKNMVAYSKLGRKSNKNFYKIEKCKMNIETYKILNDKEMLQIIKDKMTQLEKERMNLDYEYRQLPSESAADKWAVFFIKEYIIKHEKYSY